MPEYILTLNSEQAREIRKAAELLMRLKLNQHKELLELIDYPADDYWDRKEKAEEYLKLAFDEIYKPKLNSHSDTDWKDTEWYRLYNLYQVIRKAVHDAEYPESDGVDAYEPIQFTEEPLPKIEWRKV